MAIEIKYRGLHADSAFQVELQPDLGVIDKPGQAGDRQQVAMNKPRRLTGGRQRQPLERLTVSSSDRRKGAPLVGNQAGFNASSLSPRQFSDCKQNTHRANRHFDHKYGPERGPGASGSQSVHCSPPAKFVFRVRTSATVCLSLPRKRLARLLAKRASAFAPAMALWEWSKWSWCGPRKVMSAAPSSISASLPRGVRAFCTKP